MALMQFLNLRVLICNPQRTYQEVYCPLITYVGEDLSQKALLIRTRFAAQQTRRKSLWNLSFYLVAPNHRVKTQKEGKVNAKYKLQFEMEEYKTERGTRKQSLVS